MIIEGQMDGRNTEAQGYVWDRRARNTLHVELSTAWLHSMVFSEHGSRKDM